MPLEEIRKIFEKAETERDPERKFSFLEEALDLSDDFFSENQDSPESIVLRNVRHSHLRRLLAQLTTMHKIDVAVWFNYIKLLVLRVSQEIDSIVASDTELASSYRSFMDLWRAEILAAAERTRLSGL